MTDFVDIPGFEGLYLINREGQVRSIPSPPKKIGRKRTGALLKIILGRGGYHQVTLRKDGKQNNYLVHRLIATTFIPNPDNKPTVNHKNSVRTDNSLQNLEWATYSENNKHAYLNGRNPSRFGEDHPGAKLTEDEVRQIRRLYMPRKITMKTLAGTFGVTPSVIHAIIERRTWK